MDTTIDFGRRMVQLFWDPEPTNDVVVDAPVWCLGSSYKLNGNFSSPKTRTPTEASPRTRDAPPTTYPSAPITPPHSTPSSFDESLAYEEVPVDGGWPSAFLDDFESRLWMTYRSEFEPIAKPRDPKAFSALSFPMRIKSQLVDQNGFVSDSGWGCMIRSGQMLLANTVAIHRLGRSTHIP